MVWQKAAIAGLLATLEADKRERQIVVLDEAGTPFVGTRLSALAKSLQSNREALVERSRSAYQNFKASLDKKIGYLVGNGPSQAECLRLP